MGADLSNADLESGNFEKANFTNANLTGAMLTNTQARARGGGRARRAFGVGRRRASAPCTRRAAHATPTRAPRANRAPRRRHPPQLRGAKIMGADFSDVVLRKDVQAYLCSIAGARGRGRGGGVLAQPPPPPLRCAACLGAADAAHAPATPLLRTSPDGTNPATGVETRESLVCP